MSLNTYDYPFAGALGPTDERAVMCCFEGGSNKQYIAVLRATSVEGEPEPRYTVALAYGPRGFVRTAYVAADAVSRDQAQALFYRVLGEKLGKGYRSEWPMTLRATGPVLGRFLVRVGKRRPEAVAEVLRQMTPEQAATLRPKDLAPFLVASDAETRLTAARLLRGVAVETERTPPRKRAQRRSPG